MKFQNCERDFGFLPRETGFPSEIASKRHARVRKEGTWRLGWSKKDGGRCIRRSDTPSRKGMGWKCQKKSREHPEVPVGIQNIFPTPKVINWVVFRPWGWVVNSFLDDRLLMGGHRSGCQKCHTGMISHACFFALFWIEKRRRGVVSCSFFRGAGQKSWS